MQVLGSKEHSVLEPRPRVRNRGRVSNTETPDVQVLDTAVAFHKPRPRW